MPCVFSRCTLRFYQRTFFYTHCSDLCYCRSYVHPSSPTCCLERLLVWALSWVFDSSSQCHSRSMCQLCHREDAAQGVGAEDSERYELNDRISLFSVLSAHPLSTLFPLAYSSLHSKGNDKWRVIDSAIGREGFKVILLLRITPLFPFSIVNYLYGLTSVNFWLVSSDQ